MISVTYVGAPGYVVKRGRPVFPLCESRSICRARPRWLVTRLMPRGTVTVAVTALLCHHHAELGAGFGIGRYSVKAS